MDRLPGFRDFCPAPVPPSEPWSATCRQYLFQTWRRVASQYGFQEYDGPPLEPLELFTAKSGDEIVGQLYHFTDKGGRNVALRPEMTPTLARLVATHARHYKKPIKWFSIPQLFRYERQQKGRLREHFQLNADLFGEADPAADAELIALLIDCLRALRLGPADFYVRLSSRNAWKALLSNRCPEPDPNREYQFYQAIDKLERTDPAESERLLGSLGFSLSEIQDFIAAAQPTPELQSLLDNLEARGLRSFVEVDYGVIRGLAYYTGTVFEAFDRQGQFRAIAGGGRYDHLVKLVSHGRADLPGLGFGMGDVVLTELLRARNLLPSPAAILDAYCLPEDPSLHVACLQVVQQLRDAGFRVDYPLTPAKADKQLKRALDLNPLFLLRLQRRPDGAVSIAARNTATREEILVAPDQLIPLLARGPSDLPGCSNH
jgi:histidyl-tRNA synthetase